MRGTAFVTAVVVLAVLGLRAPQPIAPPAAITRAAATTAIVELRDDTFSPDSLRIEPGDSVMWINRGRNPHNVIEFEGAFASKILQTGDTYSVTFPKIGAVSYYCSLHGAPGVGMHGTIYVGITPEAAQTSSASHTYPADPPVRPAGGRAIRVPRDFSTIQAAVDAAKPGDMVLIAAGTYHEAVKVTTPHLVLRGEDRNAVILEGGNDPDLKNGVAVFGADGVVIENMTARHYALNGFYWRSVWGYRGSYLTAEGNGDYGIYAFDSGVGQFDHSYASGSPDSGFYIGQCDPCNALVTDVIARYNAIGFSGTNATGNLVIRDSEWSDNMSGIVPNTLDREGLAPQRGQTVVGNWVHGNNNRDAPAVPDEYAFFGVGIALLGVRNNEVAFNRVADHSNVGIAVAFVVDQNVWLSENDRVHDNVVWGSGVADLALIAPSGGANCFANNTVSTTLPPLLESLYPCGSPLSAIGGGDVGLAVGGLSKLIRATVLHTHPHGQSKDTPPTPPQPGMPDITQPAAVAGPPARIDPAAEVRRAASRQQAAPGGTTPVVATTGYALFGYVAPIAAVAAALWALAMRIRQRPLPRRRFLLLPLAAFALFVTVVFVIEQVR